MSLEWKEQNSIAVQLGKEHLKARLIVAFNVSGCTILQLLLPNQVQGAVITAALPPPPPRDLQQAIALAEVDAGPRGRSKVLLIPSQVKDVSCTTCLADAEGFCIWYCNRCEGAINEDGGF
jgi:hypothetical protein